MDLSSFRKATDGDIVTPNDPDYPAAIGRWALNAQIRAQVVAFVKSEADVALAIKYAKGNQLPLAIKCGGHSVGGASSTDGLVIDLSRHMNGVRIDAPNKLAYVGGGALWETVDKAAIQYGLASVAGTVNHVGFPRIDVLRFRTHESPDSIDWRWRVCLGRFLTEIMS